MSRYYYNKKSCFNCKGDFQSVRSDAKYCSTKCRKAADRQRRQLKRSFELVMLSIETLFSFASHRDFGKDVELYLDSIASKIIVTDSNLAKAPGHPIGAAGDVIVPSQRGTNSLDGAAPGHDLPTTGEDRSGSLDLSVTSLIYIQRLSNVEFNMRTLSDRVEALEDAFEAVAS